MTRASWLPAPEPVRSPTPRAAAPNCSQPTGTADVRSGDVGAALEALPVEHAVLRYDPALGITGSAAPIPMPPATRYALPRYVERNALRSWPCVQGRGLAMGLSLALASIARIGAEAAFTMAHTAIAELGGSRQRTAHRRGVGRCAAMCSAWPTIRGREMGGIDRPPTRFGINRASPWPSESPTCARRTYQRGLTPLIP